MRTSADFSHTVRSGARIGRRNLVLYVVTTSHDEPTKVGFIVAKIVGNAVTRNLVKRRLREIAVQTICSHPTGINVVVRALPAASDAEWKDLVADYQRAFSKVCARATGDLDQVLNGVPLTAVVGAEPCQGGDERVPGRS